MPRSSRLRPRVRGALARGETSVSGPREVLTAVSVAVSASPQRHETRANMRLLRAVIALAAQDAIDLPVVTVKDGNRLPLSLWHLHTNCETALKFFFSEGERFETFCNFLELDAGHVRSVINKKIASRGDCKSHLVSDFIESVRKQNAKRKEH